MTNDCHKEFVYSHCNDMRLYQRPNCFAPDYVCIYFAGLFFCTICFSLSVEILFILFHCDGDAR
jgi:hypothetical protein